MKGSPKVKCESCGKEYAKSYIKRHINDVHGTGKEDRKKVEETKQANVISAAKEVLSHPSYKIPIGEEMTDEQVERFLDDFEFIEDVDSAGDLKEMSISQSRSSGARVQNRGNDNNAPDTPTTKIRKQPEQAVQKKLEKRFGGGHHTTPAGIIDILTPNNVIIEIKEWRAWKDALGQLLAYFHYLPNCMLHAHFFGPVPPDEFRIVVVTILTKYGIKVTWEGQNGKR